MGYGLLEAMLPAVVVVDCMIGIRDQNMGIADYM